MVLLVLTVGYLRINDTTCRTCIARSTQLAAYLNGQGSCCQRLPRRRVLLLQQGAALGYEGQQISKNIGVAGQQISKHSIVE
ncbi:hypothetical protein U9M48_000744 [Paspalum notatum var. saurae]|uniref:Uncharacterized protein n=1 Tax=Paspalum notatum var. saurae TaxID=547442 RepID=A0AAQ3PFI3_PASNO